MVNVTLKTLSEYVKSPCSTLLIETQEPLNSFFLSEIVEKDKKKFLFSIKYCSVNDKFNELRRYVEELDVASERSGVYKGYVIIDLTNYINDETSDYLDAFLAYLYDNKDYVNYIFTIKSDSNYNRDKMLSRLTEYFNIESFCLNLYEKELITEYIHQHFQKKDCKLSNVVLNKLSETILSLSENSNFSLNRVSIICDSIINATNNNALTNKVMIDYFESENFKLQKTIISRKNNQVCGFSFDK